MDDLNTTWRPRLFSELVGQDVAATILKGALGRGKVAHAYLFCGPRGTGKTSAARILARAVNCKDLQQGEPCNGCPSCIDHLDGRTFDLIELDAASNRGIDEIRKLRETVNLVTMSGGKKVYIVDEAHMLTDAACNALLKTLEEPPDHVIFILATTAPFKLPQTVVSRCQRVEFRPVTADDIAGRLATICWGENITPDKAALGMIAGAAQGSVRDAVNYLQQIAAAKGDLNEKDTAHFLALVFDTRCKVIAQRLLTGDLPGTLVSFATLRGGGADLRAFWKELVETLEWYLLVKIGSRSTDELAASEKDAARNLVETTDIKTILWALSICVNVDLREEAQAMPIKMELALVDAAMGP